MSRDPRRNADVSGPGPDDVGGTDMQGFADRFDRQWNATVGSQEDASALDPVLWDRIRNDSMPQKPRRSRQRRRASAADISVHHSQETHRIPDARPVVPPAQWHRGLLLFAAVAVIGCLVVFMPGGSISPRQGSIVREAPQVVTPVPGEEQGCNVVPLTREEVLAIVLDPEGRGFTDDHALFATPPPEGSGYPHTQSWLPEANGSVDMAGGPRPVRLPTSPEFAEAKLALDRYLRCQSEGTNFQLWALESPVEVQRQVLTLTRALYTEELTEAALLRTIDDVGPALRAVGEFNIYMFFHEERGEFDVRSNPDIDSALVADDPETGEAEYAWIATQWVEPNTDEVLSSRGASLDATPASPDGTIPNLVVLILRHDAVTDSWLVEWFVPTI